MLKRLTKMTLLIFIASMILASAAACGKNNAGNGGNFSQWGIDWDNYRPNVQNPSENPIIPDNTPVPEEPETPTVKPEIPAPEPETPNIPVTNTYTAMVKSNTANLNLRSAPTTGAKVVGKMDKGDMVRYEGLQNGWYKTVYKQKTAYIYAGNNYATVVYMKQGSDKVERVIAVGEELLGYPYVWGSQRYHWGNGKLNSNFVQGEFDCSALMQYIFYKGADVLMDLNTRTQVLQGKEVGDGLKRGDVMFFTNDSRVNKTGIERVGHVALYLGDNYILHTASDHAVIEEISPKRWSYFIVAKRFV